MERPPSQLENMRPSGLKPPSRLPAMGMSNSSRTLLETSQSELNARSAMLPPGTTTKHKISGLPEPPPKRKTLVERAAEPLNPPRQHVSQLAKPTTISQPRTLAESTGHQRTASNTSGAGIFGNGRGPNRQHGQRQGYGRPPSVAESRPAVEEVEDDAGVTGKRKGTLPISFLSENINLRKTRAPVSSNDQVSADTRTRSQHSGSYGRYISSSSDGSTVESTSTSDSSISYQSFAQKEVKPDQHPRSTSLCTSFAQLFIDRKPRKITDPKTPLLHKASLQRIREEASPSKIPKFSCTPTLRHAHSTQALQTPSPLKQKPIVCGRRRMVKSTKRNFFPSELPVYLTKEKLTPTLAWDTKGRLEDMEQLYAHLRHQFASAADSKNALEESLALYKDRVQELSQLNKELSTSSRNLSSDLERARSDLHATTTDLRQARRDHERDMQDAERKFEKDVSDLYTKQENESRRLERELEKIAERSERQMEDAKRAWEKQKADETTELTTQHWEEIDVLRSNHQKEVAKLRSQVDDLQRSGESRATESATEVQLLRDSIVDLEGQLKSSKITNEALRVQLAAGESRVTAVEQEKVALISKTHFLEGNQEAQSLEFTTMSDKLQEAINMRDSTLDILRKEEALRRKLNATVLELRGNIRVFVRTRPLLVGEEEPAKVEYPDLESLDGGKEMIVHAPTTLSATGKERNEKHNYSFDRVFDPAAANTNVFNECKDLIQSVVDGYNVSILSYGQTGSGKTYGMSGPNGIIPSSIGLLLAEMQRLRTKGWEYAVDASFVEVYNETLNDLLGDARSWDEVDELNASVRGKKKEKHEIHHDTATGKTTVTNLAAVSLWPPPPDDVAMDDTSTDTTYTERAVTQLLDTAAKNRRVAATKANERSSRSHSIFLLTLRGHCAATNEASEGVLNLVDLAGSERLKQSGAEGNRMKETQAINKSLSSLGDVIAALGSKKGDESHIPYRNSKLTYLLQSSLGGTIAGKSSRTLMLLHLSPLQAHWQESRSSLLFGSKVHGTHIGTAKKK